MSDFALGKYRIIEKLAHGGMATIYLAEDVERKERVAVKQILPHIAEDEEFIKRFIHETKVMMRLNHPNILPIIDAELGPKNYYIVMPLIDRGTLKDLLVSARKIPSDFSVYIVMEILKALDYAHQKGIIHRDLKPSNIMFDSNGGIFLTDFGVARVADMTQLTQTGEVLGTPGYMSPEQALGIELTPASDLFSIGIILYELLTGYNPFQTDNPVVTMKQVVESHPPALLDIDPSIPPMLEPILLKLMKKQAGVRYDSAIAVMEDMMAYWEERDIGEVKRRFYEFILDPQGTHRNLMARESKQRFKRAGEMWLDPDSRPRALWEAYQAVRLDPDNEEAKIVVERWRRLLGSQSTTEEDPRCKRMEEKWRAEPENVQLLLQLGKLYRVRKDYINLMKVYQRLEQLNPQDPYTINQMQTLLKRPGREEGPPPQEVRVSGGSIFQMIPWWAYVIAGIALFVFLVGKMIDTGRETMQTGGSSTQQISILEALDAIRDTDDPGPGLEVLAECEAKEKNGDINGAFGCYQTLLMTQKNHPKFGLISLKAGINAYRTRHDDEASESLRYAYDMMPPPGKWTAALYLARSLDRMDRDNQAEEIWRSVIDIHSARYSPAALLERARYYRAKNMMRTAGHDLEDILNLYPSSPEAAKAKKLLGQ